MDAPPQEQDWAPRIEGTDKPIYLAIADAIGAAIAAGELRAGKRLPTHRALADTLGVDLTTVTRAYAEARRRGLLQATVGRGTFIRSHAQAPSARTKGRDGPVDLGMNLPPLPSDPPLEDLLQQGLSRLLAGSEAAELLTYRSGSGAPEERMAGAVWLRPTLGELDPERVLVCPGAQPALLALLGALAGPGDAVLTDTLTYPGIRGAAAQLGIRLVGVAADAEGLLPEAVQEACREVRPKALYCVPTIHNPTTVTMPLERRRAIAEVARRHDLRILEDDAYGLLPSVPLPAVAALAPELSFYVSTVSKVLSPALRVAYLVVPDARWAARLCAALRANVLMASPLLAGLLAAWIQDGTAGTVVSAIRRESAARQKMAREVLPTGLLRCPP
jgi:DNA-binding transcriptional MocR family regulator